MDTLNYYLSRGAAANKLVLGLPSYGRTFVLTNRLNSAEESPMNRTIVGNGFQGPYTLQDGFMGYNEVSFTFVKLIGYIIYFFFIK